ncbi:flagellar hook-associated protein 1 [Salmonella enterica subsp. enterica serovar Choleraesuis]|nr:flagellar hook-associated protein 1 [Salmonella enterica subsp. enterica serovar Choleraesuis]
MSSSLINSAMSGLSAAQVALNTVSNNLASYNVAGYSRQTTVLSSANSTLMAGGWVGNGVNVSAVRREYDEFITGQLLGAQSQSSGLTTRYQQMSKVDNLLSSTTNSVNVSMQEFFSALQTAVSNADDPAARQALLGKGEALVNQFQSVDSYLRDQEKQINSSVVSSVEQINNYASQIASLNQQISRLTGVGAGASPNALLDQRDQLVSELNQVIGVEVSVQDGNVYNISLPGGYSLVQGERAGKVVAMSSPADSGRTTVGWVDAEAGNIAIPEKLLTTGSLGGALTFRSNDLDSTRNRLGQLALSFADAFNQQHEKGYWDGDKEGGAFFTIGAPEVLASSRNAAGGASLSVAIENSSKVQASNYDVKWQNGEWKVTRLSDGSALTPTNGTDADGNNTLSFEGLTLTVTGTPAENDSFRVKPVSGAILGMSVAISDESQVALAQEIDSGASDNRNGQALLDLQKSLTVGGNKTFNDAWASLVSDVGNRTSTLKTSSTTQNNVVTQLSNQQQSISGVNLDEEYGNLQRYQQYYLANAQVLQTASSLFDAILAIR